MLPCSTPRARRTRPFLAGLEPMAIIRQPAMRTRLITKRGGPVYVRSGGATVTLVPELAVREWRFGGKDGPVLRVPGSQAVFVIDDRGVRRLALRAERWRVLVWLGLGFAVALLLRRILRIVWVQFHAC